MQLSENMQKDNTKNLIAKEVQYHYLQVLISDSELNNSSTSTYISAL